MKNKNTFLLTTIAENKKGPKQDTVGAAKENEGILIARGKEKAC